MQSKIQKIPKAQLQKSLALAGKSCYLMKLLIFVFVTALSSTVAFAQNLSDQHKEEWGKEKGSSMYLLQLFPGSPAKIGSKIAGLPKPDNCL